MAIDNWAIPSDGIRVRKDEVHVWLGSQHHPAERIEAFRRTLSADERERAARFHFERDRAHFIAARGMLRQLLGSFLELSPERVRFHYGQYGKPSLSDEYKSSGLEFNISHSGGKVLLAFTIGRAVGVDVEEIRPNFATGEIAKRFFSVTEVEKLGSLPKGVQAEAFFNCWTRKEAYIKAFGEGLSCPLDKFDVTLAPGEPPRLLATRVERLPVSRWAMTNLDVGKGYCAAMVVEEDEWQLKCWRWGGPPSLANGVSSP